MSQIWQIYLTSGWIRVYKNGKEVPTKNAVAALIRIYGNCILYFYKAFVAIVKKIQFFSAGYRDQAGSRVQGKAMTVRANEEELLVRYLVIGDILQNLRWYHAVEMWQWCKPLLWLLSNPVCLVCASCLWNLNEVALVVFVVVADYVIKLSTFMLLLLLCLWAIFG